MLNVVRDEDRSESPCRAILRCTSCRKAHVADFSTVRVWWASNGRMAERRAVIRAGREVAYHDRYDLARVVSSSFECVSCGNRGCDFKVVVGRFSESVKCGARCRNAVGPACDCACSGENHGIGHPSV